MTDPVDRAAVREMFDKWAEADPDNMVTLIGYSDRGRFRRMLDALPVVSPEGPAWQPIETAPPKTYLLLWIEPKESGAFTPYVGIMAVSHWPDNSTAKPTHWMPLPSPPAQATAEKETS